MASQVKALWWLPWKGPGRLLHAVISFCMPTLAGLMVDHFVLTWVIVEMKFNEFFLITVLNHIVMFENKNCLMNIKCFSSLCPPFCAYIFVLTNHGLIRCAQKVKSVAMKKPIGLYIYCNAVPLTGNFPTKQGRSIKLAKRLRIRRKWVNKMVVFPQGYTQMKLNWFLTWEK